MRPRHADLFASDLSKSELITMIDRVLMFYVSTADRLQRTSVWMENMEGALFFRFVAVNTRAFIVTIDVLTISLLIDFIIKDFV